MPTVKELDAGQLDLMWNFLKMGEHKASAKDVERLKENLDSLRQLLIQKTGGQDKYKKEYEVSIQDTGTIVNIITMQTMSLYLSGALDKLSELLKEESNA